MKDFDFLFGLVLGEQILKHTDNVSKTIQASSMPATDARSLSQLCIKIFETLEQMKALISFGLSLS